MSFTNPLLVVTGEQMVLHHCINSLSEDICIFCSNWFCKVYPKISDHDLTRELQLTGHETAINYRDYFLKYNITQTKILSNNICIKTNNIVCL